MLNALIDLDFTEAEARLAEAERSLLNLHHSQHRFSPEEYDKAIKLQGIRFSEAAQRLGMLKRFAGRTFDRTYVPGANARGAKISAHNA